MIKNNVLGIPPKINRIRSVVSPLVDLKRTNNGISIYEILKSECEVVFLEIVFKVGRFEEDKKMISRCTASLLTEGAGKWSSSEISEIVEYYGASLNVSSDLDHSTLRLVCLKKYFSQFEQILIAILNEPHFDSEELSLFINRKIERLKEDLSKNDLISFRYLTEAIFGADHPYGYNSTEELYQNVTCDDLKAYFNENYRSNNAIVFLAGDVDTSIREALERVCHSIKAPLSDSVIRKFETRKSDQKQIFIPGSKNQTSIKMGRHLFGRSHKDFYGVNYLTTVLGGYFGSRLVSNLREDKAITYGIYATVETSLRDGYFMISTEVRQDAVDLCISEIYKEFDRLKKETISAEESEMVNNYLMGNYLTLLDGPFNSIKAIKTLVLSDIPLNELNSLISHSISFSPEVIRDYANKYLNRNDFWEVTVGISR